MSDIKFGVMLPVFIQEGVPLPFYDALQVNYKCLGFDVIKDLTLEAERLGYHSIWVSDHLMTDKYRFECWTTLSALSSITNRIRLGTMVICSLFRFPSLLAKMSATLDVISKGKLELGIGACWGEKECKAYGIPFPKPRERIERLEEAVEILKKLWTEEEVTYKGKYYQVNKAFCLPRPLQRPHPPITIGGGGSLTLRVVAKQADRCNFDGDISDYSRKLGILEKYCFNIGRNPKKIEKSCSKAVFICESEQKLEEEMTNRYIFTDMKVPFADWLKQVKANSLIGTPEECIERIYNYMGIGVKCFILRFGDLPSKTCMRLFAERVFDAL